MKKTLIAFLTITILPILAYGYVNESACKDINNCPAGCGISFAGTGPVCKICPAGTYRSQTDNLLNPHYECESCGSLPEQDHTTLSWYRSGAENIDECKYTFECETGYIIKPEYQQVLALTNNIISINDPAYNYTEICSVECGLNSYPNANQTACVCATGTYVKDTTKDTETTNGKDCVPYIVSLALNNPESTHSQKKTLNILTTLNNNTKKYILPGDLNNIDQEHNTQDGTTTIRKTIWGKNLDGHNDTGYKIESWDNWDNADFDFNDIQQNYTLYPKWVEKTFTVYLARQSTTPTPLQLYNKNGEQTSECTYNSPNECYTPAPSESGYEFSHWSCLTHDYKNNKISCTTHDIYPVDGTSPDLSNVSYGNDIVLTENWTPKTIRIKYYTSNSAGQSIATNDSYQYGQGYTAKHPDDMGWGDTYTPTGMTFKHWICTTCSPQETFTAGTNISTKITDDSIEHTLTAHYDKFDIVCNAETYLPANEIQCTNCPQGYYCTGGTYQHSNTPQGLSPCPAGSTSKANSVAITDCYITDQTKICDNSNNCFQIPEDIEIHHN